MAHELTNPCSYESANWSSTRYEHIADGFIIDGDYYLVKTYKPTGEVTEEWVWNDIKAPFPRPEGEGIPVLVNPDYGYYIWLRKPEKYHPCWLIQGQAYIDDCEVELIVVDMISGDIIGHGLPVLATAMASTTHKCEEDSIWWRTAKRWYDFFRQLGYETIPFRNPSRAEFYSALKKISYGYAEGHGNLTNTEHYFSPGENPKWILYDYQIAQLLWNREPLRFTHIIACYSGEGYDYPHNMCRAFTKNRKGHYYLGMAHGDTVPGCTYNPPFYRNDWYDSFQQHWGNGLAIPDAYDAANADVPCAVPGFAFYEGELSEPAYSYVAEIRPSILLERGVKVHPTMWGNYVAGTTLNLWVFNYVTIGDKRWVFDYWSGDASGTSTTTAMTMDRNRYVVANFRELNGDSREKKSGDPVTITFTIKNNSIMSYTPYFQFWIKEHNGNTWYTSPKYQVSSIGAGSSKETSKIATCPSVSISSQDVVFNLFDNRGIELLDSGTFQAAFSIV